MGKTSLAGTSLVAAIPGGILAYLMLMSVLNSFEPMPMLLKVAAILALVTAAALALFPAYVLIWYGGRGGASRKTAATETAAPPPADEQSLAETQAFVGEDLEEAPVEEFESGEFEAADEFEAAEDLEEFESEAEDFEADELSAVGGEDFEDEFEFEEFEDDEDK